MGRKGQPQRNPTQIAKDRAEIARRALLGGTQQEIGEALGLSQSQVSRDLKRIRVA